MVGLIMKWPLNRAAEALDGIGGNLLRKLLLLLGHLEKLKPKAILKPSLLECLQAANAIQAGRPRLDRSAHANANTHALLLVLRGKSLAELSCAIQQTCLDGPSVSHGRCEASEADAVTLHSVHHRVGTLFPKAKCGAANSGKQVLMGLTRELHETRFACIVLTMMTIRSPFLVYDMTWNDNTYSDFVVICNLWTTVAESQANTNIFLHSMHPNFPDSFLPLESQWWRDKALWTQPMNLSKLLRRSETASPKVTRAL